MMMTDFFWFLGPHAQDNDLRVWMVREEAHPLFRKGASLVTLLLDHRGPPQYFHMQSLALAVARPSGAPSYRRWLTCDEGSEAIERVAEEINPPRSQCSEEGECEADRLPAVINLMREGPCMGVWLHPDLFAPFVTWLRAEPPSAPLERRPALPAARVVDGRARAAESAEVRRFVAAVLGDKADGEWCKERARMHDPHALPGGSSSRRPRTPSQPSCALRGRAATGLWSRVGSARGPRTCCSTPRGTSTSTACAWTAPSPPWRRPGAWG
eukprot:jgi/Mesvir1/13746/Mv22687-RA.1